MLYFILTLQIDKLRSRHYLQYFLHPDSLFQSLLLQLDNLILQGHYYTLPPLEGTLWDSVGQVQQDPRMMAQELKELLETVMEANNGFKLFGFFLFPDYFPPTD